MSSKAQEVALDRLLVDRFKSGDAAAFDEMVSRYWDRIYAMVNQLLRNSQDAEEVTQDAFIRAHRGLTNFRGDSAFSTWLYQIATNLARNRVGQCLATGSWQKLLANAGTRNPFCLFLVWGLVAQW